jgi:hypothetical protein
MTTRRRGSRNIDTEHKTTRWSVAKGRNAMTPQLRNDTHRDLERPAGRWWRLAGLFGLGWFVLFAVGAIVLQGEPPAYDASLAEVRQFFTDHGTRFLVGDYLAGLAFLLLFLPFVVGFRSLLGAAEGGPQIASRLVLVGGLATVLVGDTATVFQDTLALGAANPELQDATVRAFLYANAPAIAAIGLPAALFTLAASVVIWTTAVLWRWLAVVGVLAGVLLVVGAAFPLAGDPTGPLWTIRFLSFIALLVFVVAASIGMLLRAEPAPSTTTHPTRA